MRRVALALLLALARVPMTHQAAFELQPASSSPAPSPERTPGGTPPSGGKPDVALPAAGVAAAALAAVSELRPPAAPLVQADAPGAARVPANGTARAQLPRAHTRASAEPAGEHTAVGSVGAPAGSAATQPVVVAAAAAPSAATSTAALAPTSERRVSPAQRPSAAAQQPSPAFPGREADFAAEPAAVFPRPAHGSPQLASPGPAVSAAGANGDPLSAADATVHTGDGAFQMSAAAHGGAALQREAASGAVPDDALAHGAVHAALASATGGGAGAANGARGEGGAHAQYASASASGPVPTGQAHGDPLQLEPSGGASGSVRGGGGSGGGVSGASNGADTASKGDARNGCGASEGQAFAAFADGAAAHAPEQAADARVGIGAPEAQPAAVALLTAPVPASAHLVTVLAQPRGTGAAVAVGRAGGGPVGGAGDEAAAASLHDDATGDTLSGAGSEPAHPHGSTGAHPPAESGHVPAESGHVPAESGHVPAESGAQPTTAAPPDVRRMPAAAHADAPRAPGLAPDSAGPFDTEPGSASVLAQRPAKARHAASAIHAQLAPSTEPSTELYAEPSGEAFAEPSAQPSAGPSAEASAQPIAEPFAEPFFLPIDAAANSAGEGDVDTTDSDAAASGALPAASALLAPSGDHTFAARAAPSSWAMATLRLVLCVFALMCASRVIGWRGTCGWHNQASELWDAARDSLESSDDGSYLPLVAHATPRAKRPTRVWRIAHAFVARARAFARMRGSKLGGGAASSAMARGGAGANGSGGNAQLEMSVKRRQTPGRLPAGRDGVWDSPQTLRNLSMPALSRLVSEVWTPRLLDSTSDPPALVSGELLRAVCQQVLPRRYGIKDWRLVFSTEQHGCSLQTAYTRLAECTGAEPCVLLLLDTCGHVFGAYCSTSPRPDGQYHGTGETCLFSAKPQVRVYRWSHANELFVLGGHDFFAFGSGPAFGLRVDSSFEFGSSGTSDTFKNECVASACEFRIVKAELWGFV